MYLQQPRTEKTRICSMEDVLHFFVATGGSLAQLEGEDEQKICSPQQFTTSLLDNH